MLCVFNDAASGYVKALPHLMFGKCNYQPNDLVEMDYSAITRAMGCKGIHIEDPAQLAPACANGWKTPQVRLCSISSSPAIRQGCCPGSVTARSLYAGRQAVARVHMNRRSALLAVAIFVAAARINAPRRQACP